LFLNKLRNVTNPNIFAFTSRSVALAYCNCLFEEQTFSKISAKLSNTQKLCHLWSSIALASFQIYPSKTTDWFDSHLTSVCSNNRLWSV